MRNGQEAIEFIMCYGWAILTVLAVIGALFYFGIIGSHTVPFICVNSTDVHYRDSVCVKEGFYEKTCGTVLKEYNETFGITEGWNMINVSKQDVYKTVCK